MSEDAPLISILDSRRRRGPDEQSPFWRPMSPASKSLLTSDLGPLGTHRHIRIVSVAGEHSQARASELAECVRQAGGQVTLTTGTADESRRHGIAVSCCPVDVSPWGGLIPNSLGAAGIPFSVFFEAAADPIIIVVGDALWVDEGSRYIETVTKAFDAAQRGETKLVANDLSVAGRVGIKLRIFLNNLVDGLRRPRYLGIGLHEGAAFCSALSGNRVSALGVDDWQGGNKSAHIFYRNLAAAWTEGSEVSILATDFQKVNYKTIGKFNLCFYDEPRREGVRYCGPKLIIPSLEEDAILVVNDWNYEEVREATNSALDEARVNTVFSITVRVPERGRTGESHSAEIAWHNGVLIAVVS